MSIEEEIKRIAEKIIREENKSIIDVLLDKPEMRIIFLMEEYFE